MKTLEEMLWKNNAQEIKKVQKGEEIQIRFNCLAICCGGFPSGGGCR